MYSRALRIPSSRVFVVLLSVQMLAQSNPRLVGNQSHVLRFSDPRIERALSLAQRGRTGTRGASHGSGISRLSASDHSPSVSNLSLDTSSIFAEAATYDSGGGFGDDRFRVLGRRSLRVGFVTARSESLEDRTGPVSPLIGLAHCFIIRDCTRRKQASRQPDL